MHDYVHLEKHKLQKLSGSRARGKKNRDHYERDSFPDLEKINQNNSDPEDIFEIF